MIWFSLSYRLCKNYRMYPWQCNYGSGQSPFSIGVFSRHDPNHITKTSCVVGKSSYTLSGDGWGYSQWPKIIQAHPQIIQNHLQIIQNHGTVLSPSRPRGHPPSHASDQTQCPSGTSVSGGKLTAFNGNSGDLMVINNGSINGDFSWFKNGLTMVNNQNIHGIYPLVIEHSYRTY